MYSKERIVIESNFTAGSAGVVGNFGKMQQVIMNLVSNARDAMLPAGGKILIQTHNEGNSFVLRVSDTGPGIPKENLQKIFDAFFSTKEVGKGTGLGLSISHSIISSMNGKVEVCSELGGGATFSVVLPLSERLQGEIEESVQEKRAQQETFSGKALIVEDEEEIRAILQTMLEKIGLQIELAEDGDVALEKVKRNKYDIIFTDLKMPRMSGDKLIEEIRGMNIPVKIVIVSGGIATEYSPEKRDALWSMADAYVKKPYTRQDLLTVLRSILKD
jgi:CheY-like chemotaxis protein